MVTLGVIGVVSAMTIPSLMNNYQRQTYVTQLSKVYTELSQALKQYQTDSYAVNLAEAGLRNQAASENFISSYFKVVDTCNKTFAPCFAADTAYRKINGGSMLGLDITTPNSYVLASGASVRPLYMSGDANIVNIFVDVNGQKGPNVMGRDAFMLCVYRDGTIDDYLPAGTAPLSREARESNYNTMCATSTSSYGCFGKILNDNWQMTY